MSSELFHQDWTEKLLKTFLENPVNWLKNIFIKVVTGAKEVVELFTESFSHKKIPEREILSKRNQGRTTQKEAQKHSREENNNNLSMAFEGFKPKLTPSDFDDTTNIQTTQIGSSNNIVPFGRRSVPTKKHQRDLDLIA